MAERPHEQVEDTPPLGAIGGFSAYSKVTYQMTTRTAALGHAVAHIPMGHANKMGRQMEKGVTIYESGENAFGEDLAPSQYVDFGADILVVFKETWNLQELYRQALNFVPYCAIDHSPVSTSLTSRMQTAFRVLTPSRHGQMELRREGIENVHYLPHGVDTKVYRPLDKAACRKQWFLDEDDFVVLFVGWNRVRKMIPRMLRVYKRFLELNPDAKAHFMLWTRVIPDAAPQESVGVSDVGVNLIPEIMRLSLASGKNDVRWFDPNEWSKMYRMGGIPEWDPTGGWDMVKLYNCANALLSTTGGEGFGETLIEAQACGVPVETTDYAAGPEQVGAGYSIPPSDYIIASTPGCRLALVDIDKAAEALTKIYNADRAKLARRARAYAERYDWPTVIDRYWKPFLDECEGDLYPKITKEGVSRWA